MADLNGNEIQRSIINDGNNNSLIIPEIENLPDEAKGLAVSKLIDLQNQREQRQLDAMRIKLEHEDKDKQRAFDANQRQLDREAHAFENRAARDERREERDYRASESALSREHESNEKTKDRAVDERNNIRNNKGAFLSNLNVKNIAISIAIIAVLICGIFVFLQQRGLVEVPDSSRELIGQNVDDVYKRFYDAGFNNIEKKPVFDSTKPNDDQKVKTVTIKGRDDFKQSTKFNPDDIVLISYYEVGRGYAPFDSKEVVGMNIDNVRGKFEEDGFNNIKCDPLPIKGNEHKPKTVEKVSIDGNESYSKTSIFEKNSEIVITYYDYETSKMPKTNKKFNNMHYDEVRLALENSGFVKITVSPTYDATNKTAGKVFEVSIDGNLEYDTETPYKQDSQIVIKYHDLPQNEPILDSQARVPFSSKDVKKINYSEAEGKLKEAGFTEITTLPVYDATSGFLGIGNNENIVIEVLISGEEEYECYKVFPKNASVTIRYHAQEPENKSN